MEHGWKLDETHLDTYRRDGLVVSPFRLPDARLAAMRHRQGIGNLLQVLAAEDAALSARRGVTDLEARAFLLDISLIRALGGGFSLQSVSRENSDQ